MGIVGMPSPEISSVPCLLGCSLSHSWPLFLQLMPLRPSARLILSISCLEWFVFILSVKEKCGTLATEWQLVPPSPVEPCPREARRPTPRSSSPAVQGAGAPRDSPHKVDHGSITENGHAPAPRCGETDLPSDSPSKVNHGSITGSGQVRPLESKTCSRRLPPGNPAARSTGAPRDSPHKVDHPLVSKLTQGLAFAYLPIWGRTGGHFQPLPCPCPDSYHNYSAFVAWISLTHPPTHPLNQPSPNNE